MKKIITAVKVTELGDTALRMAGAFKKVKSTENDPFLKTNAEVEKQALAMTTAVKSDQAISKLEESDVQRD